MQSGPDEKWTGGPIMATKSGPPGNGVRVITSNVLPNCSEIIEDVRSNGTPALERIQTSGSVAAYELALVLR